MITTFIPLFLSCTVLIFLYMTTWFGIAIYRKDNGIADIAWGLGFVLIAWFCFFICQNYGTRQWLINGMVTLWGLRLAVYIYMRNKAKKGEDFRYKNWRKDWGKNWKWRSFWQVFMLQGGIMLLVAIPIMLINKSASSSGLNIFDGLGIVLFAVGLYWEAVADYQLYQFKRNPSNQGKVMMTGLWQYSRHPNYFGEMLLWWGIFVVSLSALYPLLSLISPLLISYLLMRVSGVPMLEKKYENNPAYRAYQEKTNAFFPNFRLKNKS